MTVQSNSPRTMRLITLLILSQITRAFVHVYPHSNDPRKISTTIRYRIQPTTRISSHLDAFSPLTLASQQQPQLFNDSMAENIGTLSPTTTVVIFVVGLVPFVVAAVEFWRRIAVGASFGTGDDRVAFRIGQDDAPKSSRGERILGVDALVTAVILFAIAFGVLGLVLYAVATSGELSPMIDGQIVQ